MFRLILNIVKRILGHDDLIVLFLSKIELNEELKSIFAACCDITACCEMFKCVTEAVVQSDDLTRQKHEQQSLIELIFHDQETIDILEYMDVKFFNETISPLRNVYDWIQCLLQVDSCKGLKQLLKFFLDKFNDDQVSALVSVITQVRTSYEDNGQRSSASIWTHFVHGNLRVIDDIEKLLKRVSQLQDGRDALKNLVLHDDGNGAAIVRAFQNKDRETFEILARFLTEEEKQENWQFIQLRMAPHKSIRVIESVPGDDSSDDEVQLLWKVADCTIDLCFPRCFFHISFYGTLTVGNGCVKWSALTTLSYQQQIKFSPGFVETDIDGNFKFSKPTGRDRTDRQIPKTADESNSEQNSNLKEKDKKLLI